MESEVPRGHSLMQEAQNLHAKMPELIGPLRNSGDGESVNPEDNAAHELVSERNIPPPIQLDALAWNEVQEDNNDELEKEFTRSEGSEGEAGQGAGDHCSNQAEGEAEGQNLMQSWHKDSQETLIVFNASKKPDPLVNDTQSKSGTWRRPGLERRIVDQVDPGRETTLAPGRLR
ncbi:hypothetical protein R1sor_001238 [Riccia sorocarpa]|uniref:Uncharacterized protein n=1 Tax=Riccia sorocarpa TaxID=122646 RepID=A0ABD3GZK5_9MARC